MTAVHRSAPRRQVLFVSLTPPGKLSYHWDCPVSHSWTGGGNLSEGFASAEPQDGLSPQNTHTEAFPMSVALSTRLENVSLPWGLVSFWLFQLFLSVLVCFSCGWEYGWEEPGRVLESRWWLPGNEVDFSMTASTSIYFVPSEVNWWRHIQNNNNDLQNKFSSFSAEAIDYGWLRQCHQQIHSFVFLCAATELLMQCEVG